MSTNAKILSAEEVAAFVQSAKNVVDPERSDNDETYRQLDALAAHDLALRAALEKAENERYEALYNLRMGRRLGGEFTAEQRHLEMVAATLGGWAIMHPTAPGRPEAARSKAKELIAMCRGDSTPRVPGCQCQWEAGDSPCRVHGGDEESIPVVLSDSLAADIAACREPVGCVPLTAAEDAALDACLTGQEDDIKRLRTALAAAEALTTHWATMTNAATVRAEAAEARIAAALVWAQDNLTINAVGGISSILRGES